MLRIKDQNEMARKSLALKFQRDFQKGDNVKFYFDKNDLYPKYGTVKRVTKEFCEVEFIFHNEAHTTRVKKSKLNFD